jgi:HlyD family secretion protein
MTQSSTMDTARLPAVAAPHRLGKLVRLLVVGLLAIAAVAVVVRIATRPSAPPVRYVTGQVDRGRIAAKVTATGTLSALVTVSVGSQVSGRIAWLGADFGSVVHKDQVVAKIDPALFQASVEQARANHLAAVAAVEKAQANTNLAARQADRAQRLHAEGLMSQSDLDTARATLAAARGDLGSARAAVAQTKAALDQASLNLHYTTIISPIDGIVISRNVDVGQTVAATLQAPTLFTIAQDLGRMQVDTNVTEADVGKVRAGMPVSFTVDAYPDRVFDGKVRQVRDNAQTLQNVVTYDAVIDVDNKDGVLKPGMTASVTFVYADEPDVLRVPTAALRFKPDAPTRALMGAPAAAEIDRPNRRVVWVRRGEHVAPVVVEIGISDGTRTQVLSGDVRPGDVAVEEAIGEGKR